MDNEKGTIEAKLQFKGIELLHCNTSFNLIDSHNTIFNFDINTEIQVNKDHKIVNVVIVIKIYDKDKEHLIGDVSTSCLFFIENFSEVVKIKEDNSFDIPINLITILNSISLSTSRGVLWSSFRGTPLHNAIIPIVNPKDFTPQSNTQ